MARRLTWCEVSTGALAANLREFRSLVGPRCELAVVVKSNAYGHGLVLASRAFRDAGADVLCVQDLWEAEALREAGIGSPVHVLGRVEPDQAPEAVALDVSLVVYDADLLRALDASTPPGRRTRIHLKVETGTHRQGVSLEEALALADLARSLRGVEVAGVASHFADVEDTTHHDFARRQMDLFREALEAVRGAGWPGARGDLANSAATILWPEAHLDRVRLGIGAYGMWPSAETRVSAAMIHRDQVSLRPALTWKSRIAQVKKIATGEFIGYGRTWRTPRPTLLAVIPVGYADGYDRGLSNLAHVLIRGQRAAVRGRVCMNMTMVDVTDIPGVVPGEEVVLLGSQGDETLTAERLAQWAGTINYEITTRIAESVPRVPVETT
ncbi:alanine racemase [Myxococcota bacterium]|nr:alanine racemase [Myxococcota bacterium]